MKIPKPIRRGHTWRVCVSFDKKRYTSTHDTEDEAKEWAARKLIELKDRKKRGEAGELPTHTLHEAVEEYLTRVTPLKKGARWEILRLRRLMRENPTLAQKNLIDLKPFDFTHYRDSRLKEVTPTTVSREMELLTGVLNYCVKELGWLRDNPSKTVRRPALPPPRNRRAEQAEIDAIVAASGYHPDQPPVTIYQQCGWCVLFAVETAMRQSEITGMLWKDVNLDGFYVTLHDTKNGSSRTVPLSEEAERLLRQMQELHGSSVLSVSSASLSTIFRKLRDRCGIDGLRFHDLRHEAATRMAQIIQNPADLAKITGHQDINVLVNTYYNPTPTEVAQRLRAGKKQ